jgi:hypothetical protein
LLLDKMGRKAHPLAARIKKIMQADQDVGKIAQATPIMIGGDPSLLCALLLPLAQQWLHGSYTTPLVQVTLATTEYACAAAAAAAGRALELFLEQLCKSASEVATARKAKTLTCSHV